MAATSGVSHFQKRSECTMPGVYRIHFANAPRLLEMLSADDSLVGQFFRTAIYGQLERQCLASDYQGGLDNLEKTQAPFREYCQKKGEDYEKSPFNEFRLKVLKYIHINPVPYFDAQLQKNDGYDVVTIKQMLHHFLGIEKQVPFEMIENKLEKSPNLSLCGADKENPPSLTPEERQHYFELLKNSGFLESPIESVLEFQYQSGPVIQTLLQDNPHVDTLVLGCGRQTVVYPTYGCTQEPKPHAEHTDSTLSIDQWTGIDPHVHANFKDIEMLRHIPADRLRLISDHSNGGIDAHPTEKNNALFCEFHRILRPGGSIAFVCTLDKTEQTFLKNLGFAPKGKMARKPHPDDPPEITCNIL